MDRRVYLDNAATSFPKPPCVAAAMAEYAHACGAPARGGSVESRRAAAILATCRERINRLIGGAAPERIAFTLNTTDAMNLAIKGVVLHALTTSSRPIHLITTELDHNSALRPLNALVELFPGRITQTRLPLDTSSHIIDPDALRRAIRPETLLFVTLHASNVTGAIQPIAEYGRICRERGVLFLLDAAQSLGHIALDAGAAHADLVAFPGHKGLLGPTGTGGLYIAPGVEHRLCTVREGGTGWQSEDEAMPDRLPDRFEPGSHNMIGIAGLNAAAGWLLEQDARLLRAHEASLLRAALAPGGALDLPGLRLIGPRDAAHRIGVLTFVHDAFAPLDLARALDARGVVSRAGLHCAPLTHGRYGTRGDAGRQGGLRLSFGPFTTQDDLAAAGGALREILGAPTGGRGLVTTSA